jgi:hypothetical protein
MRGYETFSIFDSEFHIITNIYIKSTSDIDECSIPGTCHEKAKCINTPGRFFCQCMEGFSGDGATECVASILYPYEESQGLSKERRAKVDWKLKQPLAMLGKERSQITVTNTRI